MDSDTGPSQGSGAVLHVRHICKMGVRKRRVSVTVRSCGGTSQL